MLYINFLWFIILIDSKTGKAMITRKQTVKPLDRTDRRILECLQDDGRMSNVALAKKVNLTPTPCLERVKRLLVELTAKYRRS